MHRTTGPLQGEWDLAVPERRERPQRAGVHQRQSQSKLRCHAIPGPELHTLYSEYHIPHTGHMSTSTDTNQQLRRSLLQTSLYVHAIDLFERYIY